MHTLILVTAILSLCLCAISVVACWRAASACALPRKQMRDMQNEIGELNSAIDNFELSLKRLRSREGMAELRLARAAARGTPPAGDQVQPVKETKAQARARIFGGKSGPDFAKQQLDMQRGSA